MRDRSWSAALGRRLGFQGAILFGIFGSVLALSVVMLGFTRRFADEVFALAVNPEAQAMAEAPLALYPELLRARREAHLLRTELLARDPLLLATPFDPRAARAHLIETCASDAFLQKIDLLRVDAPELAVVCPRERTFAIRTRLREIALPAGGKLRVTFGMPEAVFEAFARAGESARAYRDLAETKDRVRAAYQRAFAVVLGAWLLLGGAIAMMLARRTTRRLRLLAAATARLAEGDLEVQVPVAGHDELAELARDFNTMVRELAERSEQIVYLERVSSWQDIARRLAHEIKNPLTPIQLAMQQLCSSYTGDDPAFTRLLPEVDEIVREEVQTLRRLVTAFSEFARLPDVDASPHPIASYLRDFVRGHPELSERANLVLTLPEADPEIDLDRTLLGRVFTNLVLNAIEAAEPQGDALPRVELRLQLRETLAVIQVSDEGPGIPADTPSRIFDPYFTTKATGTGLGLAISRKIVLQHGGELTLSPTPGPGATFEVRLPRPDAPSPRLRSTIKG